MEPEPRPRCAFATASAIRHILVATDFGSASNAAVGHGVALAKHFGAELTLVHVWQPPRERGELADETHESVRQQEQAARQALARAHARARRRLPRTTCVFRAGPSVSELLKEIERSQPDLVIVGAYGRGSREQVLLGSVAEKLSQLSPAPVLVVRDSGERKRWFRGWHFPHHDAHWRFGLSH